MTIKMLTLGLVWVGLMGIATSGPGFLNSNCRADDWPHWMGPTSDGVWHETDTIDRFPSAGPNVLWRQTIGSGYAGPSVVGDRLFVMDRTAPEEPVDESKDGSKVENNIRAAGQIPGGERIRCLDVATGKEVWSYQYDCPYKIAYPTGPRCTPTVDGDYVYCLGAMGRLICLKKDIGSVVWEKELTKAYEAKPPIWGYASHPLVDGDKLIVPVGGKGSAVVAFNKNNGEEIWKAVTTLDVCYAPLVMFQPENANEERQLIFWHADGITSLDPASGDEYWFVKFPEERNPSQTAIATPTLNGNQLLISEFYKGSLLLEIGSNPPSVTESWRQFKINPKLNDAMNAMMATPVIQDGHIYGNAFNQRGQGVLRCTDLATGAMKWNDEDWLADKPLIFATGFIVPNGDKCFIFNDIGELMIGKFSPQGFEELDRAKLLEPTSVARGRDVVWSHPAFAGGKMFVRNDKEIICVDLKKPSHP